MQVGVVEMFDIGVLIRRAGLNEPNFDLFLFAPIGKHRTGELGHCRSESLRLVMDINQLLQEPGYP